MAEFSHFGRKFGAAMGNFSARDSPLFEPTVAVFTDVGVGQAVSVIVEGGFERHEPVAALAKEIEDVAQVVGFEVVAVEKDDLREFVAKQIAGEFFVVLENFVGEFKISGHDLLLKRGIAGTFGSVVKGSESPVFGIERNRSDAITARDEEGFKFTARLKVAANVEKRMTEVAHGFAVLREKGFGNGFTADDGLFEIL